MTKVCLGFDLSVVHFQQPTHTNLKLTRKKLLMEILNVQFIYHKGIISDQCNFFGYKEVCDQHSDNITNY